MIPATVLTGYLGAGKTTLLNRILTGRHGRSVAVIVNEFGEIGIDNDLVLDAQEDMILMSNGCLCCKFRGDIIRSIHDLLRRPEEYEAILIETTGLADPGPIAQSFFVDDELKSKVGLDAIVTLVDAKHIRGQLERDEAARLQIAFADVTLLNKADLVTEEELARLGEVVRAMNAWTRIHPSRHAEVPLDHVLGVGGFDLSRKPEVAPDFEAHGGHAHGDGIGSVSLREPGALDGKKLNAWLGRLLKSRGQDIYRMKGIVEVSGESRRVVFQGVHMMFDGRPDRPWRDGEDRTNRIVFIGRDLPEAEFREGLRACKY